MYPPVSLPTFDLTFSPLLELVGNTQSHASVRAQEIKRRRMVITPIAGGKAEEEVAAIEQPVAGIGLTMSKKTQLASSARSSTLPVVAILCHVTRGTTAVADFVAYYIKADPKSNIAGLKF